MANQGDSDSQSPSPNSDDPVVVCIGASAGGLRALQTFFAAIPPDTGASFVVIVHLDPDRRSELAAILGGRTTMPVVRVEERQRLLPNHVYVGRPDRQLEMVGHELQSVKFTESGPPRSPIDQFFRSAAEALGDGLAIILSGAGSDGAVGVRAVKESGGIVLVQDPTEAEYPSMPQSAIATGVVDAVLPARELAARIAGLISVRPSITTRRTQLDEELVNRVLTHLRVRTGHDFSKYKRSTVLRRIARRMQVTRTDELSSYYDVLRDNIHEAYALLADLLISVTTFFRDAQAFETLRRVALSPLFEESRASGDPLRVWVCGCATGEEAYSLAIMLLEEASRRDPRPSVQVFASDLDARALSIARNGRYPGTIDNDLSEDRLRRFFVREGDAYRVRQELRDIVLFAQHDLLKDAPFSKVDLISCRNVMIYLDRELQEHVISTFNYALKPGGFLMLGSSETADNPPGMFRNVDRIARIYQSLDVPGDRARLLGPARLREPVAHSSLSSNPPAAFRDAMTHRRSLEKLAPPSVLVDETHRVVHLSDNAGRFLQPAGGPLTGDIVDLVRTELRFDLRSALHRIFEQQRSTISPPIPVRFDGKSHRVLLHVNAAETDELGEARKALVMFIEGQEIDENFARADQHATDETVRRLTQELELTQARLRAVRDDSDAVNEELRATNEELQSMNEEYRSTSEELETSKQELQSINEELQTVNNELKLKLEAISRAHSDLQNLMAATDFGTLFLDSNLRIKRFTQRVTELFSVTLTDEGRPITDFAHQLQYEELVRDVQKVLSDLAPIRREVKSRAGKWYDMRLRPYRTVEDKIDGVLITFIDISDRRQVEEALRESERQLRELKKNT